ncbi:flavodoxin family protein [Anaerotignum sp. MB30-C6]|uniref:flavodoxin family protein n=1 Tax=Anaerotignum sp. MB30-C6 TaxID=3070814 RepID=UPI0027DD9434|nr:flavodoxin family protein [Anaerotignum sp. MB30-C6]WMI80399.1 flavodoxin family protein [Anaerotignum sp. MB30-C6]
MKVLMVNGSSNLKGCTFTALTEVGKALEKQGIQYEIFQLGGKAIRDCIGCKKCHEGKCVFNDDDVNRFVEEAREADGFIFGSPVYYAHPSGRLLSFLDRVFYCSSSSVDKHPFHFKPAAAVISARRGGTTASFDVINKYFTIAMMPIVSSSYWNMVHGVCPEDVMKDLEGLQTMRNIGTNMAWMLKSIACGKEHGIELPEVEKGVRTSFIR